ncbi:MAG: hypothetical protein LBR85_06530 [Oscillospiraceae bacterium]|nr:hypothetical protein [Oscillospiraceae bacterium]
MDEVKKEIIDDLHNPNKPTVNFIIRDMPLSEYLQELLSCRKVCLRWEKCARRRSANERIICELNGVCENKELALQADIIRKAEIDLSYGNQIFNGIATNPHRDYIIRLAFGFEMNEEEANRLLAAAHKPPLGGDYFSRDAVFIRAIVKGYSIASIQATLLDNALPDLKGG